MPLVNTGLVVRYYIDEAASGQDPTAVLDGSGVGDPFNLTIAYDTSNLAYTEVSGNRGLESVNINGNQYCRALLNDTSDKVRDNLAGKQKITVETVVDVHSFSASTGRIFALNRDTDNAELGFVGNSATSWQFYWNRILQRTWDGTENTRLVLHCVIDTTQGTENDRVKIYVNGTLISPTVNANPTLNGTLTIGTGTYLYMFNRGSTTWGRAFDGILYYAALYGNYAFTQTDVDTNYAVLAADDDTPAAGMSVPVAMHSYRLRRI